MRSRRDTFLAELDAQENASRVSINGAVEEAIRSTMRRQSVDAAAIESAVNQCLDGGGPRSGSRSTACCVTRRPRWRSRESDRPGSRSRTCTYPTQDAKAGNARKVTSKVGGLAEKSKEAVRAMDKVREEAKKGLKERAAEAAGAAKGDAVKAASNVPKVKVAIAALPVVLELIGMVEDFVGDKQAAADRKRRRAEAGQVTAIATRAGEETMRHWAPTCRRCVHTSWR